MLSSSTHFNPELVMTKKRGTVKYSGFGGFSPPFYPYEDVQIRHKNNHTHRFTHTPEPWAQIRCMLEVDSGLEHKSLWNGSESDGVSSEVALAALALTAGGELVRWQIKTCPLCVSRGLHGKSLPCYERWAPKKTLIPGADLQSLKRSVEKRACSSG